jgi:hypothetical protein
MLPGGWLWLLPLPLRQFHPRVTGRVRVDTDVVEQEPEPDQVELDGAGLVAAGQVCDPLRDLRDGEGGRVAVAEAFARLLERRPEVAGRVRVDVDPRGEEAVLATSPGRSWRAARR